MFFPRVKINFLGNQIGFFLLDKSELLIFKLYQNYSFFLYIFLCWSNLIFSCLYIAL